MPKIELHTHIEGTIPPSLLRKLAKRHNISIDDALFRYEDRYEWSDFLDFLRGYDLVAQCVRTQEDYYDILYHYLAQSAKDGVIYVEYFSSPDHAWKSGMTYKDMLDSQSAAITDAETDFGIQCRAILTAIRHNGRAQCDKVAQLLHDYSSDLIVGFGLAGDEINYPPEDFVSSFALAQSAGYPSTVHAGEAAGAHSVQTCLELLPISRIGHGVRAIEDPTVIEEIINRDITLEVCPGSNIALKIYPNYDEHPLRKLVESGVKITLNSDDPPHFQTSVLEEYERAHSIFGFNLGDLISFSQNAIDAAFCDGDLKQDLQAKLDNFAISVQDPK